MGFTLHQHSHSHGSLGSHSHEGSGSSNSNINVRAAYIHVLGDIIQSLGVLIAAVIVYIKVSNLRVYIRDILHIFCLICYIICSSNSMLQFDFYILQSAYQNY